MKKNNIIIISIISVVAVLGIILVLLLVNKKEPQKPNDEPKEPVFQQCEKEVDPKYKNDSSNWTHNGVNYDFDAEGNRVNNSANIKTVHQIEGGYEVSNMTVISKKCEETKAHVTLKFTNNSGQDIEFGTLNFYYEPSKTKEGSEVLADASVDIKKLKNGETIEVKTFTRTRIIDALDYKAEFIDGSKMDG